MIAQFIRALIAAMTFVFVGAQVVGDFQTWECTCTHAECGECRDQFTWDAFHADAVEEYADEFTALFNSYETRWSKNNRLMIRSGNSGSFKFVAKGK